jgi:hypothetical protein
VGARGASEGGQENEVVSAEVGQQAEESESAWGLPFEPPQKERGQKEVDDPSVQLGDLKVQKGVPKIKNGKEDIGSSLQPQSQRQDVKTGDGKR